MEQARQWAAAKFDGAGEAAGRVADDLSGISEQFFSFTYNGRSSAEFLSTWPRKRAVRPLDARRTEHTLTYCDPKTGLEVRCVGVESHNFPTVEWTLYFKNRSGQNTPILSDVQAVNAVFAAEAPGDVRLHHFKGDSCTKDSFEPLCTPLVPGIERRFAPTGGRPSNGEWPYYNLEYRGAGAILAIGWPGQWACRFTRGQGQGVRVPPARS